MFISDRIDQRIKLIKNRLNVNSYQPTQKQRGKSKSRMHQIDDLHEYDRLNFIFYYRNKLISDPYNLLNNDFQLDTIDPSKIAINRERMPELNINHSHFTINRKGRGSSSFGRYSRNNLSTSRQNASVVNLNHKLISPRIRNLIWIDQSTPRGI